MGEVEDSRRRAGADHEENRTRIAREQQKNRRSTGGAHEEHRRRKGSE